MFTLVIGILIIIALTGVRTVSYNEYAYEYEFGKLKAEPKHQGFNWIGLGHLKRLNNQFENYNFVVDASTKDMQGVDFEVNVNMRLKEDKAYSFLLDYKDKKVFLNYLENKVQEKTKTVFFKYNAEELLGKRLEITNNVLEVIQNMAGIEYFELKDFTISNIQYSDEFDRTLERKAQVEIEREIIKKQKENMELMNENIMSLKIDDYLKYQIAEKWDGKSSLIISDRFLTTSMN